MVFSSGLGVFASTRPPDLKDGHFHHRCSTPRKNIGSHPHSACPGLSAVYSGTLANAIEAAIQKQRSVAFSLVHPDTYPSADDAWPFDVVTGVALDIVARLLAVDDADYNKDVVLNVNLPNIGSVEDHKGVRIATQGRSTWSNAYEEVTGEPSALFLASYLLVCVWCFVCVG